MKTIVLSLSLAVLCAACGKNVPPPEGAPAPKAQAEGLPGGAGVAGSTTTSLLDMPGEYVKTTVGQVAKARAAKAQYEEAAKAQTKNLDLNENGGN